MTVNSDTMDLPKEIRRLDESIVNRIAAGEVVQRPANAVKELLENSLDAGATTVTITVKDGGIKSLQVQDDGCGIRKGDLPILCERHTTSKLRSFEDLTSIGTLGFRGEALASISYVSHVTVTTMTALDTNHGWKASYRDGAMDPPHPRPAAATKGTIILAEDLFYNVPLRRKALKSASEEYTAILDVAGRYAIYRAGAAIAVKKAGEAKADLSTALDGSRIDAIRAVYGAAVAKNCLPVKVESGSGWADGSDEALQQQQSTRDDELKCSIDGYVTGADYAGRKTQLVLFINGRSVDFPPLKRCLEATYAAILPKAAKPFAFLDIKMPAQDVDVNVHPTKKEVAFLHQEALVEAVRCAVEEAVLASNAQRTFTQTLLPGAPPPALTTADLDIPAATATAAPTYYRPDKLVRTDAKVQTLDAFVSQRPSSGGSGTAGPAAHAMDVDALDLTAAPRRKKAHPSRGGADLAGFPPGNGDAAFLPTAMEIAGAVTTAPQPSPAMQIQAPIRHRSNPTQSTGLASVEHLLSQAESNHHHGLVELFKSATFVGMADSHRVLLQSGTRLYLADFSVLTKDMFYQQALRRFGQAPRIVIRPAVHAEDLATVALEAEQAAGRWEDSTQGGSKEEVAVLLAELVLKKAGILADCFSIVIEEQEQLPLEPTQQQQAPAAAAEPNPTKPMIASLPQLIEQYHPPAQHLPQFVLSLGQNVNWQEESECFKGIAEALAELYSVHADAEIDEELGKIDTENNVSGAEYQSPEVVERKNRIERERKRREWEAAHVLLPAMKLFYKPPRERASDGSVIELTRLENLYRVFERC